jgi:hypothetical protein
MKRFAIALAAVIALLGLTAVPAYAQSGHFIENGAGAPVCTDIGTQVTCTGKVAGLGGTTFEITIEADGVASVECTNPGHRGHRRGQHGPASDTAQRAVRLQYHDGPATASPADAHVPERNVDT